MAIGLATRLREAVQGPAHRWRVLAAVECGHFVVYMDGFIVTLALPSMARHFGVGIHEIKWVLVAYLAAVTLTLLLTGRMADRWGRKPLTVIGISLLTLSAGLCALATSVQALIAFRIMQGLGGALVLANVMAEITAVFPREERRLAMAINASVLAMGQVTGLLLGGFLIGRLGWRSIFLVIVAVGALGLVLDVAVLRNRPTGAGTSIDKRGVVLWALIVGIPFFLIEHLSRGFQDTAGLVFLLAFPILLGLFVMVERRSAWPLLDLRLFRSRGYTCGAISASFYFIVATFGYFLMPLYGQVVLKLSPFMAGLVVVPLSLALTISSQLVSRIAGRFSARLLSTVGLMCTSIGVLGMSLLGPQASYPFMIGLLILAGAGGGLFHPPNNSSVLSTVPLDELGAANGFFVTARNFGQAIGAALAAAILDYGLGASGTAGTLANARDAFAGGVSLDAYAQAQAIAFRVGAALGMVGVVISALRGSEIQPVSEPPVKSEGGKRLGVSGSQE
jgi:EmrB/QacA subfamily drug resistance transporter